MKKVLALILMNVLVLAPAYAVKDKKSDGKQDKEQAEMRKRVEAKKTELNGSQWEVSLVSSDPQVKPEADVLTFQNGQVTSKALASKGFTSTNYTITPGPGEDDWAVWETMQTGRDGVVFIRGEWLKEEMRGIISNQLPEGKSRDYSFSTKKRVSVSPTSEKPKETAAAAAVTPSSAAKASSATGSALVSKETAPKASTTVVAPVAVSAPAHEPSAAKES